MDSQATDSASRPPSLAQSASEMWDSVRALIADEADLLAAEARVATRSFVTGVGLAVAVAVFAVLGIAALLAMIALWIVSNGYSWTAALGCVFLLCAAASVVSALVLRGLAAQKLFAASRRQLRGQS